MGAMMAKVNDALHRKYDPIFKDASPLEELGRVVKVAPLAVEELKTLGTLAGVDGSNVRAGGAHPHYIELFQGLAKVITGEELTVQDLFTPILDGGTGDEGSESRRRLAAVELKAALKALESWELSILIMDGGLLRYKIDCEELWEPLRERALERGVLLVGAIKDIKTHMIAEARGLKNHYYDKDYLVGRLRQGEAFFPKDEVNPKVAEGLVSAFYRPSRHPDVVGMDVLIQQRDQMELLMGLLLSLTPANSRGVPYWMDIVDSACKVHPQTLQLLMEEHLDRSYMERFFVSERDRRSL